MSTHERLQAPHPKAMAATVDGTEYTIDGDGIFVVESKHAHVLKTRHGFVVAPDVVESSPAEAAPEKPARRARK